LSTRQKHRQRGTQQEARKEQPVQMVNLQQFRPPKGYVEVGEAGEGKESDGGEVKTGIKCSRCG
jgi:hypothetical protein